jgi:hypothetical protein
MVARELYTTRDRNPYFTKICVNAFFTFRSMTNLAEKKKEWGTLFPRINVENAVAGG